MRRVGTGIVIAILAVVGVLFFLQYKDPMILIFAVIAATMVAAVFGAFPRYASSGDSIQVRCRACSALNRESAKFCDQCATKM